jgi:NhaP-type Na+/H+ or K+/H+ antiporter
LLLIVIYVALGAVAAWSFISDSGSVWFGIACLVLSFIMFLYRLFDAYTSTKRSNPPEFEQVRRGKKDA